MIEWLTNEGVGHCFFKAFPVMLILLFALMKGRRAIFLAPCAIVAVFIVNPLFYRIWNGMNLYAYWRLLWVVPVVPVLAAVVPTLAERLGTNRVEKAAVAAAGIAVIALGGTFLYHGTAGGFAMPAQNAEKLPGDVVEISDYLLAMDDDPRVIAQEPLGVYMRQYTGKIDSMLGRDIYGYILGASEEARSVDTQLSEPDGDLGMVADVMAERDYEYLILNDTERAKALREAGFELIDHVAGYGIYTAKGQRAETP